MPDLYKEGFDTATKIKLHILKEYIREWLPVFLKKKEKFWKDIYIYDFFAGEGFDINENPGSPTIIVEELKEYSDVLVAGEVNLKVVFNDIDLEKITKLQIRIGEGLPFNIEYLNSDFTELFDSIYPDLSSLQNSRLPRFMFLDQYGIKYVTPSVFRKLTYLGRTDFIFFISSSFFPRFAEQKEFQKYLQINKKEFDDRNPYHCHRVIFEYYQSLLPEKEFYLAPFSLKKDKGNIYGLIFGSNHSLGMEKFMNICWKMDGNTGEANFNIDNDIMPGMTLDMFNPDSTPKKLQSLEGKLVLKIKKGELNNLHDVYKFTYTFGCLPRHANGILTKLKKSGDINKNVKLVMGNIHRLDKNIKLK
ncbi:MAG: three-Cys-motif partner protein TcmP [Cyclobacteriaceae bacterium]